MWVYHLAVIQQHFIFFSFCGIKRMFPVSDYSISTGSKLIEIQVAVEV